MGIGFNGGDYGKYSKEFFLKRDTKEKNSTDQNGNNLPENLNNLTCQEANPDIIFKGLDNLAINNNIKIFNRNNKDEIIDKVLEKLYPMVANKWGNDVADKVFDKLVMLAEQFLNGKNLFATEASLERYIRNYLAESDQDRLSSEIDAYNNAVNDRDNVVTQQELSNLKAAAEALINAALEKGVILVYKDEQITNAKDFVNSFNINNPTYRTYFDNLNAAMQEIINSISTEIILPYTINNDFVAELERPGSINEALDSLRPTEGSTNQTTLGSINAVRLQYSNLYETNPEALALNTNGIHLMAKDCASDEDIERLLNNDSIMGSFKKQFASLCIAQGIPGNMLDDIFNMIYELSVSDTKANISKTMSNRDVLDKFVQIFNINMRHCLTHLQENKEQFSVSDYVGFATDDQGNVNNEQLKSLIMGGEIGITPDEAEAILDKIISDLLSVKSIDPSEVEISSTKYSKENPKARFIQAKDVAMNSQYTYTEGGSSNPRADLKELIAAFFAALNNN